MTKSKSSIENEERSFEENMERFQVYSALEIGRILRGFQSAHQVLRMAFAGTMETAVTSVLDVDVKGKTVLLDASPNAAQNEVALKSRAISFEGVLDRIKISFTVNRLHKDTFEGVPVLRASFPERLVRLQRRDHFRVPVSGTTIRIPVEVDSHVVHSMGNVRDLSPCGVCVLDVSMMVNNTVGQVYPDCLLSMPDTQPLTVTLEIRNSYEMSMPDTSQQRRIGCKFVGLSSAESALIQRYIMRLERQRKTLTG